jgi:ribose-phosphate pyrophosphokinase
MKIISGSANTDFSEKICRHLDKKLVNVKINKFADGEINVIIDENIRKQDCYIIQPTGPSKKGSPNDNYMELFILIDALKRGSANSVTVVMPYYGYERQDRKDYSRAPISARVMATILESLKINRVITFDLHAGQIQGFFSCNTPFDNLYVEAEFIKYIKKNIISKIINLEDVTIVSPDEGGVKRAVRIAGKLSVGTNTIYKNRAKANEINRMQLMGNVEGKICIMVDDMIDTGGTACKAASVLKENGALEVYMLACHGLLSGNAFEKIMNSEFTKVIITNTLECKNDNIPNDKIDIIDVSWMCAEAMRRSHNGESLKELYDPPQPKNLDLNK